jgi:hypothetical protein
MDGLISHSVSFAVVQFREKMHVDFSNDPLYCGCGRAHTTMRSFLLHRPFCPAGLGLPFTPLDHYNESNELEEIEVVGDENEAVGVEIEAVDENEDAEVVQFRPVLEICKFVDRAGDHFTLLDGIYLKRFTSET